MMIDYIRARISLDRPLPAPVHGGHFVRLDELGGVEVSTARRKSVLGSFEAKLQLRAPSTYEIEIEGNPAKFVQGHNLYGSSDPVAVLWAALVQIEATPGALPCSLAEIGLTGPQALAWSTNVSRVDCTAMLLADDLGDVLGVLRSLRVAGRLRDRGKSGLPHPWEKGEGVSFGSRPGASQRHRSITFYSKGLDARVHPLPEPMQSDCEVVAWVERSLRCEVRLGGNYLRKRGLDILGNWDDTRASLEWNTMMARMDMNGSEEKVAAEALPDRIRIAYAAWIGGEDLSNILSRPTFYRYRRAILDTVGVDIAIPRPKEPTAQIVPIRRVIELRPAGRPPWADRIDAALASARDAA